ncbi:MAG: response regulator [Chloroflexi bacterium]|nr:response regulator [Chloroflexota bacterium]
MSLTILVIEDEAPIRRFLRASLPSHGYRLEEADTGENGLRQAAMHKPDLVILDLGLPDIDGLEVTKRLREWMSTPIIVLSARGREDDKIAALDAGADDYLTKPFGMGELLARLRVALRRTIRLPGETADPVFRVGDLRVDLLRRQVWVGDAEVHLTPIEYKLLTTLVQHAGKVLLHRHLLSEVWGPDYMQENHYLRVYMGLLRHKLEIDPARPRYLRTEPGVGYRLAAE